MDKKKLLQKIGLKEKELLNTNLGALDIFKVENNKVTYGFLACGDTHCETVESFLKKALIKY